MSASFGDVRTKESTILLADDSLDDIFLFRLAYEKSGLPHTLKVVNDGEQAIKYLQHEAPFNNPATSPAPDLVLLDLKMPRMNGFEVLEWMQRKGMVHPPVVVLSGSVLERDKARAAKLGAREYLVKTGDFSALAERLKEISARWLKAEAPTPSFAS